MLLRGMLPHCDMQSQLVTGDSCPKSLLQHVAQLSSTLLYQKVSVPQPPDTSKMCAGIVSLCDPCLISDESCTRKMSRPKHGDMHNTSSIVRDQTRYRREIPSPGQCFPSHRCRSKLFVWPLKRHDIKSNSRLRPAQACAQVCRRPNAVRVSQAKEPCTATHGSAWCTAQRVNSTGARQSKCVHKQEPSCIVRDYDLESS